MKTKFAILLTSLLCLAQETLQAAESPLTWSWEAQFRSEYLGKIGAVFYDKPIMVNDVGVSYEDLFAGLWVSSALGGERYGSTFGDEFDIYAGWGHTYDWVRFQLTTAYFAINDLGNLKNDVWIVELEMSLPNVPLVQPYAAVRCFNQVSSQSPEGGWFLWLGMRRTQPLGFNIAKEPAVINLNLMTAYSDGAFKANPGWVFARLEAGLPIKAGKNLTITPKILWQTPIGGQEKHTSPYTTKDEIVGTLALHWRF